MNDFLMEQMQRAFKHRKMDDHSLNGENQKLFFHIKALMQNKDPKVPRWFETYSNKLTNLTPANRFKVTKSMRDKMNRWIDGFEGRSKRGSLAGLTDEQKKARRREMAAKCRQYLKDNHMLSLAASTVRKPLTTEQKAARNAKARERREAKRAAEKAAIEDRHKTARLKGKAV